jgi:hypothetical protein
MKKTIAAVMLFWISLSGQAQSAEAQQLLLNVEKLSQLKKILTNMYEAYEVLYKGYTAVKDISEGNFSLHKTFLDGLMEVSPAVKKYKRVADIINYQARLVKEYKSAFSRFKIDNVFTGEEIQYIGNVYAGVVTESIKNLEELVLIITAGRLRMTDDERLNAIDRIFHSVDEQLAFIKDFNNSTSVLSLQRKSEQAEISLSKKLSGF